MKNIVYYVVLIFLCSCKQTLTDKNQEMIIGEWKPIDLCAFTDKEYLHRYHFMEDGLCDYYPGFFSYFEPQGFLLHSPHMYCIESRLPLYLFGGETELNNVMRFYGNRSAYRITGDTLEIYDPAKDLWCHQQIRFESPDTMVLSYIDECQENISIPFVRVVYQTDSSFQFDQLIFPYPLGAQSYKLFSIQRNGIFMSYGYKGGGELFVGKIDEKEMKHLEHLLGQVDFNDTDTEGSYPSPAFDPKMTIINGNEIKIISAMTVTRRNNEFYQAYLSTLFSPDNIHLQPIKLDEYIKNDFLDLKSNMYSYCNFAGEGSTISFGVTEAFYLKSLLLVAEETTHDFVPKYHVTLKRKQSESVVTDGRYYRFTDSHGNFKTIDIGFNFVEDVNCIYVNTYKKSGLID